MKGSSGRSIEPLAGGSEPVHRIFRDFCWALTSRDLTDADYRLAAQRLQCEQAAIHAVAKVEAKQSAWDIYNRPVVLFERHYFHRFTGGKFDVSHPDLSHPTAGGYGAASKQFERLHRAARLDESAALKSASYGLFQIMGANHAEVGHATVPGFVDAMLSGVGEHLKAFTLFILKHQVLTRAIRAKDWAAFAKRYNGPGYAKNRYDEKMADAYAVLTKDKK